MKGFFTKSSLSILLLFFLLGVVACSKLPISNNDITENSKVTLDFLWFTDGIEDNVMKEIIQDYQELNNNVEIKLIEVAFQDYTTKLKMMIAGGKPPALGRVTDTAIFARQALDLAPYVGGVEEFTSQFLPSIRPYIVKKDKLIATPMDVTANGLIYNKTLFAQAGVTVPQSPDDVWTWDEFAEAINQVKKKGGAKYGLLVDSTAHRYSTMIYQFGGSILSEDGTTPAINLENSVAALELFIQLHKDGVIPADVWLGGENPINLFRSGTAAAHLAGNWMLSNYQDIDDFEWGVTYLPKAEIRSSVPGGKYLMAFQNSGVEKEAAEFIKYIASKEIDARFNQESLFLSARIDNSDLEYKFGKEMFAVFSNELSYTPEVAATDWANQVVISKIKTDMRDIVMEALIGTISSQEAMDKIAELIEEIIDD